MIYNSKTKGFIALISILIVGAVLLVVSVGVSLRSIGESAMSFNEQQSSKALALANLCAETALMKLESVFNYGGSDSVTVGGESCTMEILGSGNLNRTIRAKSTVSAYTRKVRVEVARVSPVMQISSWEEVGEF